MLTPADRDGLSTLTDVQVKAALAGDWEAFVKTFAQNVTRMPPDVHPIVGRDNVAAWVTTLPRITHATNWIDAADGDDRVAYMRGHNLLVIDVQGRPMRISFKWLAVYRKEDDGSWKMVADMWNGNPLPPE